MRKLNNRENALILAAIAAVVLTICLLLYSVRTEAAPIPEQSKRVILKSVHPFGNVKIFIVEIDGVDYAVYNEGGITPLLKK